APPGGGRAGGRLPAPRWEPPASVRMPPPARLVVSGSLSRPLPFALPTRASIHIALRAMTATAAGQPAMDPEDGGPAEAEGVSDPVSLGESDAMGAAGPGADQAANTAARIAVLRNRLMTPMPTDRVWGWIGPLIVTAFAAFLRFNR